MSRTVNIKVMEKIVDRLASGETLVDITKDKNMPSYRAVTGAVAASESLWELYRKGAFCKLNITPIISID